MRFPISLLMVSVLLSACGSSSTVSNQDVGDGGNLGEISWPGEDTGIGEDTISLPDTPLPEDTPEYDYNAPDPGAFGAPCTSNLDCESGYCIEGLDGYICTKLCLEDCPLGYQCVGLNEGPDIVFVCMPLIDRACEPCSSDIQCSGGRCVPFESGGYCLSPCDEAGGCKEMFSCATTDTTSGDSIEMCIPTSGTCECVPASVGLEKACKKTSGTNLCYGVQFCEAEGWGACELPVEICDGEDNDCDNIVDNGFINPATGYYETDSHCGACNNSCKQMLADHSFGKCDPKGSGSMPGCVWKCESGWFDVNTNPTDGCECRYLSAEDDPDEPGDSNCDGMDGEIDRGIFVAKNGTDSNPGTLAQPLLTIQAGIQAAQLSGVNVVYVATGVYTEAVTVDEGLRLYGGYSADFSAREPFLHQSAILGPPPTESLPGALNAMNIETSKAIVSGFHIFGGDAIEPGGSSYAVYIGNCDDSLELRGNWIFGGNGRDARSGEDGLDGTPGVNGSQGQGAWDIGTGTCTQSHWTQGGNGGQHTCGAADVSGGSGGTGVCPDYDENGTQPKSSPYLQVQLDEEFGKDGAGPVPGAGGNPGWDSIIPNSGSAPCGICNVPRPDSSSDMLPSSGEAGQDGAAGPQGTRGKGCDGTSGQVDGMLWTGLPGQDGTSGGAGSGGGGGAASGGVETESACFNIYMTAYVDIGGAGGGAGSGGCQGMGGSGGESGGGSFGIIIINEVGLVTGPVLSDNVIRTGFGGNGGAGGAGGVGGPGGFGAAGGESGEGTANAWCAEAGGEGGNGGDGGHGGGGGGGCGGPSFAIYTSNLPAAAANSYLNSNDFDLTGEPGLGGPGGKSLGNPGTAGSDGFSGALY